MHSSVIYDPTSIIDIDHCITFLQQQRAVLTTTTADNSNEARLDVMSLDCFRLIRLAFSHFGKNEWDLVQLANVSGEPVRRLHGLTGALGRVCNNRGLALPYNRHSSGKLFITDEFFQLLQTEEKEKETEEKLTCVF